MFFMPCVSGFDKTDAIDLKISLNTGFGGTADTDN